MDAGSRVLHLDDLPALDDIHKLLASDDSPVLAGFLLRVMRQLQLDDAGLLEVTDASRSLDMDGNTFGKLALDTRTLLRARARASAEFISALTSSLTASFSTKFHFVSGQVCPV